jgi:hypothetical protein
MGMPEGFGDSPDEFRSVSASAAACLLSTSPFSGQEGELD